MKRFVAGLGQIVEPFTRVAIVFQRFIEELAVGFLFEKRQQRAEGGFDIAYQCHIHFTVGANTAGIDINLNDFGIRRIEGAIGELGAEQDQGVGVHHGVEAGGEANQPGHPHIIRIVVFNVLFAAQRMNDRRFELLGERHQLFMRPGAAATAHQGDVAGIAQQLGQLLQLFFRWRHLRQRRVIPVAAGAFRRGF